MNEDMKVNTDEFFAVVFRKIKMDDLGLFVFKPIDVVVGKFTDVNGKKMFIDEEEKQYLFTDDAELMNDNVRYVVGDIYPKALLTALFQGQLDEEQMKDYLFQQAFGRLNFGMYIEAFNKVELSAVNLNESYNNMYLKNLEKERPEEFKALILEEEKKYLKNKIGFNNFGKQDLVDPFKKKNTIGFINEPKLSEEEEEAKKPKQKVKIGFQLPNDKR